MHFDRHFVLKASRGTIKGTGEGYISVNPRDLKISIINDNMTRGGSREGRGREVLEVGPRSMS